MKTEKIVLIKATNLANAAQLALTFAEARKYFAEFGLPQPPLPIDVATYAGCDLEISEREGEEGGRTGKVVLTNSSGIQYEQDWVIARARA